MSQTYQFDKKIKINNSTWSSKLKKDPEKLLIHNKFNNLKNDPEMHFICNKNIYITLMYLLLYVFDQGVIYGLIISSINKWKSSETAKIVLVQLKQ